MADFYLGFRSGNEEIGLDGTFHFKSLREAVQYERGLVIADDPECMEKEYPVQVVNGKLTECFVVLEFENGCEFCKELNGADESTLPDHVEWLLSVTGRFLERIEWHDGIGYERLPGDGNEKAGTRFIIGDCVTVPSDQSNPGRICVVGACPGKRSESRDPSRWENIYRVYIPAEGGEPDEASHEHIHESRLRRFDGFIEPGSGLWNLSARLRGRCNRGKNPD